MPQDLDQLRAIVAALKEPFSPDLHEERELPGGKSKWFYVRWQNIRARLDEVYPAWEVAYTAPVYLDKYCSVSCKITIAGVSREAIGNAEIELLSKSGRDMSRGTAIERAIADSFKNACEAWGVCRYLDEQSKDGREFTIRYLHGNGDGRAVKLARDNDWIPGNLPSAEQRSAAAPQKRSQPTQVATEPRSPLQERFEVIRKWTGHKWPQIKTITEKLFDRDTKAEPLESWEADQLRNDLLIDRAISMGFAQQEANSILGRVLATDDTEDVAICSEFLRLVGQTLAAKEEALQAAH